MSRRLILALVAIAAIALVVGPAFAAVQNVKVSGDEEVMAIGRNSFDLKSLSNSGAKEQGILNFLRLRVDADLTDNVSVTTRLLSERLWGIEDSATSTSATDQANTDITLDLASVTLKEFLYSPLTLTVGRQELHMGSEMIVGDPDTNNAVSKQSGLYGIEPDLSKRKSFDAFRATFDYSPLVIDAIYAKINEKVIGQKDDATLWGLDANYALKDKWSTMLEPYFYQRIKQKETFAQGKADETNVFGVRAVTKPIENLVVSAETAYQSGRYQSASAANVAKRSAWAAEAGAGYTFAKARYTPTVTALYAYFSGDSSNWSATNESHYNAWDPMYENQKYGDITNSLLGQTNIHVVGLQATMKPMDDISAGLNYYAYWWARRYADGASIADTAHTTAANLQLKNGRRFVGQELDANVGYDYTEDVQFNLAAGVFMPGSVFKVPTNHPASQVIGSMKVAF